MSEHANVTQPKTTVDDTIKVSRDDLRAALLGKSHQGESKELTLFGMDVELHQPTFADIMGAREDEDEKTRAVNMLIKYVCVPGTSDRIFEPADKDTILEWPFGKDLVNLQNAITELTGLDIADAEQEITESPLLDS